VAEPQESGLNERRFHLDSAIGSESQPPAIVLRSLAASFWKVTHRGSNESSGSRHAAGISAILKWNQTCVVNQPVLSSRTSGEANTFHFGILSAFWLTT
jgi:hypothetical protein